MTSLVRQQRHLGTRIIVATQEPTLAPGLLDLCNVSIVHRFNSPAWFKTLRQHLAGARLDNDHTDAELFELIVGLKTGEALVFCPSAMLDFSGGEARRLNEGFIRARVRDRVTADGGRSILASDRAQDLHGEVIPAEEIIVSFSAGTRLPKAATQSTPKDQEFVDLSSSAGTDTDDEDSPATSSASQSASATKNQPSKPQARSKATPKKAPQPPQKRQLRKNISQKEAGPYLCNAASAWLTDHPTLIEFTTVRNRAAAAAGLPQGFFTSSKEWKNWSKDIINGETVSNTPIHDSPTVH